MPAYGLGRNSQSQTLPYAPTGATPAGALKRGEPYFRFWGPWQCTAVDSTAPYWTIDAPFEVMAIGPNCDISRYVLFYLDAGVTDSGLLLTQYITTIVSVGCPFIGRVIAPAYIQPLLPFGNVLIHNGELMQDLMFYFQAPASPPLIRGDFQTTSALSVPATSTEEFAVFGEWGGSAVTVPIMGRKTVRVAASTVSAGTCLLKVYGRTAQGSLIITQLLFQASLTSTAFASLTLDTQDWDYLQVSGTSASAMAVSLVVYESDR